MTATVCAPLHGAVAHGPSWSSRCRGGGRRVCWAAAVDHARNGSRSALPMTTAMAIGEPIPGPRRSRAAVTVIPSASQASACGFPAGRSGQAAGRARRLNASPRPASARRQRRSRPRTMPAGRDSTAAIDRCRARQPWPAARRRMARAESARLGPCAPAAGRARPDSHVSAPVTVVPGDAGPAVADGSAGARTATA